jgi:hypothetical protein
MRTPFSWLCQQESLPWFDGQIGGSVIPLHAHGHNRSTHDETSYPSTSTLNVYASYGSPFLTKKPFTAFSGFLGEASQRFQHWILTLANYFYPLGL